MIKITSTFTHWRLNDWYLNLVVLIFQSTPVDLYKQAMRLWYHPTETDTQLPIRYIRQLSAIQFISVDKFGLFWIIVFTVSSK
jgi:hypothetical protein